MKIARLVLFLFLLSGLNGFAQVYDFKSINQENGLPSSVITCITQDSRDLIWIGTDGAGLVKYDGTTFFTYDLSNGLKGTFITAVVEDANHNLVIGTKYQGIFVFDGAKFFKEVHQGEDGLKSNFICKLLSTPEGIYCLTDSEIVLINNKYEVEKLTNDPVEFIEPNSIVKSEDYIYIGAANGLFVLKNKKLQKEEIKNEFGYTYIAEFKNKIYVSTYSGKIFQVAPGSPTAFKQWLTLPRELPFNIKNFFIAKSGNIWLAGDGNQGLYMYDGDSYIHFNPSNGFLGENVSCFFQDRSKQFYIGTSGTGLYKSEPQIFFNYSNLPYLNNSLIFSILNDGNKLYAGIRREGVCSYTINKDGTFNFDFKYPDKISANTFLKNKKGQILVGSSEGLYLIKGKNLEKIKLPFPKETIIHIVSLKQDEDENYLIGTYGEGLIILNSKFELITKQSTKKNGSFANYVSTIDKIANEKWYIGTNTGVYVLEKDKTDNYEITNQVFNDVIGVSTVDANGVYWCTGTNCIYSIAKGLDKRFDKSSGLTSTLIYTLCSDKNGAIWSGHNLGLDKIIVTKSGKLVSIKNYNSFNGFKGLETNMRSQYVDDEGNIYLGTVKGLIKCNTSLQIKQASVPQLVLTNLKVFNKNRDWRAEKNKSKWFNMPNNGHQFKSRENQLTFEFTLINPGHANNYYYSYKLTGLDKNWSSPTLLNEVTYSNLDYGKYIFNVRLVDENGNAISKITKYSFNVETPFYFTWWFILLVILFLAVLFLLVLSKTSTYNKEFVKDYSEEYSKVEEVKIYLLFFGIVAPLTEFYIYLFNVRVANELIPNILIGLVCLTFYFLSKKSQFVTKYIYVLFFGILMLYTASTAYKIYFVKFELITFSEFLIILFFSYSFFKTSKQYWLFTSVILIFLISLFYNENIPLQTTIIYLNAALFSILISQAKHISSLNSKARLLFTDTIVNKGSSLVIAADKNGKVTFMSQNVKEILGYAPSEMLGDGWWKNTIDKNTELENAKQKILSDVLQEGTTLRKIKTKWDTYKWIQWNDKKFGNETVVGIGQDVTERIHAQTQYRNLIQTATDIIYESNKYGDIVFINKFAEKFLGYTTGELILKHYSDFVREDYKPILAKFYLTSNKDTKEFDAIEFPLIKKNGEEVWVSQKVTIKKDENGDILGYSGIIRDISKIKAIELAIKESENNFRQLNETIDDVFWLYDIINKKYIYISPSCERVLGLTADIVYAGESLKKIVHPEDLQLVIDANVQVDSGIPYEIEYRIYVRGELRWIQEKSFAIKDEKGVVIRNSGICADITERILYQQKIDSQAQIVKQYSIELEFHNTIKEKLIQCKTIEEVSLNALGFIKSKLDGCEHIALLLFDNEKKRVKGHFLKDERLINEEFNIANVKSFEKCKNGEIFIEHNLTVSNNISVSDKSSIENGIQSYIVFPLNYMKEMIGILSIGFSRPFDLLDQEIKNIKDSTEIISITLNQLKLRNRLERYSKDLEFQNIVKQKLINASSIEDITTNALAYVVKETNNCVTISVNILDERKSYLEGFKLLKNELIAETWRFNSELKCFDAISKKEYYIEYDLNASKEHSYTDSLYLDKGERSYIVLPILDNNDIIGTLSVGFNTAFQLNKWEINRLEEITFILGVSLKHLKLSTSIFDKNNDITSSINYAKSIQQAILPNLKEMKSTFKNVALIYKPKDIVSGDFYGAIEIDNYTYFYSADCTGHGVPGAFITLLGNMIIEQITRGKKNQYPAEILTQLDEQINSILNQRKGDIIRDGMEIAFCLIDKKSNTLHFSGAGMGLLYYIGNEEYYFKGQRKAIGENKVEEFKFVNQKITFTGEEQFYIATDGYQDQLGGSNYKRFSKKELMILLRKIKFKPANEQEKILNSTLEAYVGKHKQIDDITVLGFSLKTNANE